MILSMKNVCISLPFPRKLMDKELRGLMSNELGLLIKEIKVVLRRTNELTTIESTSKQFCG